jgi:hypothetical protein
MQVQKLSQAVGIFDDQKRAVDAVRALLKAGFPPEQITIRVRDWKGHELVGPRVEIQQAAASGAVRGAIVGGIIGLAAGLMLALIPASAWGAALLILMCTGVGAAVGVCFGPFFGMSWRASQARQHAEHIEAGRTVVLVRTPDREDEAHSLMADHGAYDFSMSSN